MTNTCNPGGYALIATLVAACSAGTPQVQVGAETDGGRTADGAASEDGAVRADGGSSGATNCTAGLPTSFAAPTPWTIPTGRCETSFDALASGAGSVTWSVLPLRTDSAPSLVVAKDACDATVGRSHWSVYDVSGQGYASMPRSFTLPAARCETAFDTFGTAVGGALEYTLIDLDVDGLLDLVVTRDTCDPDVGVKRWDVYASTGAGFAATPSAWAIPRARCQTPFDRSARSESVHYSLLDLDGDKKLSLVVTKDTCDASVGVQRWDIYRTEGFGFSATPTSFGLPAPRCTVTFDEVGKDTSVKYTLVDLTADKKLDLVVTHDTCDAEVGAKRWDVYANGSVAFAAAPKSYGLPTARCQVPFNRTRAEGNVIYTLADLSCDHRPDLVVSSDSCDNDVGRKRWDVYEGGASAFGSVPATIALPTLRCQTPWESPGSSASSLRYSLVSLDTSDEALVVTKDPCDTPVGKTQWDRYAARK